jgi:lipopolysaccharide export system protein LptA
MKRASWRFASSKFASSRFASWKLASWLSLLAAASVLSVSAAAQGLIPGAQNQSSDQPVQIDAKTLEVHDKSKTATFLGDVKVVQGYTTMTCKTLVVFYGHELGIAGGKPATAPDTPSGAVPDAQNIRRIEAHGDVTVVSRDQSASGDLGVYDLLAKTITLSGNVVVTQGKNVIHGERVVVNTVTGNAHVEAAPAAPGAPQGRVRALIIPQKNHNGGSSNFMTIGPGPPK